MTEQNRLPESRPPYEKYSDRVLTIVEKTIRKRPDHWVAVLLMFVAFIAITYFSSSWTVALVGCIFVLIVGVPFMLALKSKNDQENEDSSEYRDESGSERASGAIEGDDGRRNEERSDSKSTSSVRPPMGRAKEKRLDSHSER